MFDPVQTQFDIAARLRSIPNLAKVKFVTEDTETLAPGQTSQNIIQQVFAAAATGAGAMIIPADLTGTSIDQPLYFDRVLFDITCFTSAPANVAAAGAQRYACELATRCGIALHGFKSPSLYNPFQVEAVSPVRLGKLPEPLNEQFKSQVFKAWNCRLFTQMELSVPARCTAPTITEDEDGKIVLASATSGASIYYTVNGKYPGSGEKTATLYAEPFTLTTSCTIRAAAEKVNFDPSDVVNNGFTA